ncbi:MAG: carboxymuconolactone decarboxylase family protein [Cypionkella sp.]|uniref:carboxymuconolactone decarboxylase family protein n=1 Tax=Cypionkella sp. TaxID=2811411 RepID=UPI002AB9B1D5|nr:carboxymuconolactone decarboxylase family protein [Cypionkella sp.]MDZ4310735.1 carboxymuconolactone decarboxylase family protein [Cypionkella sp.]
MTDAKADLAAAKTRLGGLAKAAPSLMQSFAGISKVATTPGQFSAAQKELIAVAIAVAKGCEDCILYHLDAARRHGADEAALIEALEVAVEMGGGPAVMYGAKALDAWRNLA